MPGKNNASAGAIDCSPKASWVRPIPDTKRPGTVVDSYAPIGIELTAETGLDGLLHLHTICCGKVQYLADLDQSRAFLTPVGSAT